jgi:hypothetical protein
MRSVQHSELLLQPLPSVRQPQTSWPLHTPPQHSESDEQEVPSELQLLVVVQ